MATSASDDDFDTMTQADRRSEADAATDRRLDTDTDTRAVRSGSEQTAGGMPGSASSGDVRAQGPGASQGDRMSADTRTAADASQGDQMAGETGAVTDTRAAADGRQGEPMSAAARRAGNGVDAAGTDGQPPLVAQVDDFRVRWESVQIGFVDDPRQAVRQADELVTQVLDDLLGSFQAQRGQLEDQWSSGGEPSTDDLRRAFQRHRMFFDRLLSA